MMRRPGFEQDQLVGKQEPGPGISQLCTNVLDPVARQDAGANQFALAQHVGIALHHAREPLANGRLKPGLWSGQHLVGHDALHRGTQPGLLPKRVIGMPGAQGHHVTHQAGIEKRHARLHANGHADPVAE